MRTQYAELESQEQQCVAELKRTVNALPSWNNSIRNSMPSTPTVHQRKNRRKTVAQLQDESTAELEASIRDIEETNRKVRANLEKARAEDEAAQYASDYDKLTGQIDRTSVPSAWPC